MTPRSKITPVAVLELLRTRIGKGNALRAWQVVEMLTDHPATGQLNRLLRAQVMALRDRGWPICAHPAYGYWWPASDQELQAVLNFHRDRAMASLRQAGRQRRWGLPLLLGQLTLNLEDIDPLTVPEPMDNQLTLPPVDNMVVAEIPDELYSILSEWLANNTNWTLEEAIVGSLALFLMSAGDKAAARQYLESFFGHERNKPTQSSLS